MQTFFGSASVVSHEFFLFKSLHVNLFYGIHLFYLDLSLFCHHLSCFLVALLMHSPYGPAIK